METQIEISPNKWIDIEYGQRHSFTLNPLDLSEQEREDIVSLHEKIGSGEVHKYEYAKKIHFRSVSKKILNRHKEGFLHGAFPIAIDEDFFEFSYDGLDIIKNQKIK